MKKNKPAFIISIILMILLVLICVGVIINEVFIEQENHIDRIIKAATAAGGLILAIIQSLRPTRLVGSKKRYADLYKDFIGSAFSEDRKSYNLFLNAIEDYNNNNFRSAIKIFDKLLKNSCRTSDDHSAVLFFKALCYTDQGLYNAAIEAYKEFLKYNAFNSVAWSNLGLIYAEEINNIQLAEEAYKNAIKYDPQNAYAYNNFALLYFRSGDNDKALEFALEAIKINSSCYQAIELASMVYKLKGDIENSQKYLNLYGINGGDTKILKQALDNLNADEPLKA